MRFINVLYIFIIICSGLLDNSFKGFGKQLVSGLKIPGFGYGNSRLGYGFYGGSNRGSGGRKMKGRTFKQIARIANPHQYSKRNRPFPGQPFHPQGKP